MVRHCKLSEVKITTKTTSEIMSVDSFVSVHNALWRENEVTLDGLKDTFFAVAF